MDTAAPTTLGSELAAAVSLLEHVAAGELAFSQEQRQWALVEGVELSGWTLTEVQLAQGGDAPLAERVLSFARAAVLHQRVRRLAPALAVASQESTAEEVSTQELHTACLDAPVLRCVAAGRLVLTAVQRESLIVDVFVATDGQQQPETLASLRDPALAIMGLHHLYGEDGAAAAQAA